MDRVLVFGQPSSARTGLTRGLWRDGDRCDVVWSGTRSGDVLFSRAVRNFYLDGPPGDQLASAFHARAMSGSYDIVIPMLDWETWLVVTHAAELRPHVGFLVPEVGAFRLASDKAAVMAHARSLGIATPRVWDWPSPPDLDSLSDEIRFPVVVKARSGSGVQRGLRFAMDRRQLQQAHLEIESETATMPTEDFTRPLIMEFIPGFIHDACALATGGEVINVLTQVRQLMTPIRGGVGAVNITTNEPELRELARTLLESLNWRGPAQIEFKYDPRDGQYKLIELNPRLWGTLDLAIRAGMNFPAQMRDLIRRRPVRRDQEYRVGLRYIFVTRAIGAYAELARTLGMRALGDRRRYPATTFGLDWRDPIPEVWRFGSMVGQVAGRVPSVALGRLQGHRGRDSGGTLPIRYLNTLDRSTDPGF